MFEREGSTETLISLIEILDLKNNSFKKSLALKVPIIVFGSRKHERTTTKLSKFRPLVS